VQKRPSLLRNLRFFGCLRESAMSEHDCHGYQGFLGPQSKETGGEIVAWGHAAYSQPKTGLLRHPLLPHEPHDILVRMILARRRFAMARQAPCPRHKTEETSIPSLKRFSLTLSVSRWARVIIVRWFDTAEDHFGSGVRCATFSEKSHPSLQGASLRSEGTAAMEGESSADGLR
jgi:hypothetical protein